MAEIVALASKQTSCTIPDFFSQQWPITSCANLISSNIASHVNVLKLFVSIALNTLVSGCFFGIFAKKHLNSPVFAQEYLRSCLGYGLVRSVKKCSQSSSLPSKKIFLPGGWFFCEWRHKWRTFRPPWPTLPGPSYQMFHNGWLKPQLELHRFWHLRRDLCDMSWTVCWSN